MGQYGKRRKVFGIRCCRKILQKEGAGIMDTTYLEELEKQYTNGEIYTF
jgi:hypothetical protein